MLELYWQNTKKAIAPPEVVHYEIPVPSLIPSETSLAASSMKELKDLPPEAPWLLLWKYEAEFSYLIILC